MYAQQLIVMQNLWCMFISATHVTDTLTGAGVWSQMKKVIIHTI